MTKDFFAQFRPMGKPLEYKEAVKLLSHPWDMARGLAYVHVIFEQEGKIWFVLNGPDKEFHRGPDWGFPTEKVLPGEKLFSEEKVMGSVQRLILQELNIKNPEDYNVEETPIWVSKDKFGHYHFVFKGDFQVYADVFTDIPEKPIDLAGEVIRTKLVDIFLDIEEKTEKEKTILCIENIPVRMGHIGFLKLLKQFKS